MSMTSEIDSIVNQFFQKNNLEEVSLHQLEQFVNDFPYCTPGQLLLAKRYRQSNDPSYLKQASKTAIYFTNPHWLNSLLDTDEIMWAKEVQDKKVTIPNSNIPIAEVHPEVTKMQEEDIAVIDQNIDLIESTNVESSAPADTEIQQHPVILEELNTEKEPEEKQALSVENADLIVDGEITISGEEGAEHEQLPQETETAETEEAEHASAESELPATAASEQEVATAGLKLRSILDNPVLPGQGSESLIPIEPLHTVDYFASQGIKISADIEGQDRLSIKLRSFTDWLKTMKKIHPEKLESELDQGTQSNIQHIAEHSNEAKEVVTEAMAEVFAKQGLHHKATEVYRKLSLLNPDKRVYFAAKISKLNDL